MLVIRLVELEDWANTFCDYSSEASEYEPVLFSELLMDILPQLLCRELP